MPKYCEFISTQGRYGRSVNVERDLDNPGVSGGYIVTSTAQDTLDRVLNAYSSRSRERAWTLTGAYGSGKSAFAQFLLTLLGPSGKKRAAACELLQRSSKGRRISAVAAALPRMGLVRAPVTCKHEPLSHALIRALEWGATQFWSTAKGTKPRVLGDLHRLLSGIKRSPSSEPSHADIIRVVREVAIASGSGIVFVFDELGRALEYAAGSATTRDLSLLQDLAELPATEALPPILTIGLLHQSVADYASAQGIVQQREWAKVQGRFQDIVFNGTSEETLHLVTQTFHRRGASSMEAAIQKWAKRWEGRVQGLSHFEFNSELIGRLFPLHPITALVLPPLCARYGQNDRSLFSFLAVGEPLSFQSFLRSHTYESNMTLRLPELYDYFFEGGSLFVSSRLQSQRWLEVQQRVREAGNLATLEVDILKTIGLLNLLFSTGPLRASKEVCALALCNQPWNGHELAERKDAIDRLIQRGVIVWRKHVDELRLWQGSDFNIEAALQQQIDSKEFSVAEMLRSAYASPGYVAHRHSYQTGTLRAFEGAFVESAQELEMVRCRDSASDGLVALWVGDSPLPTKHTGQLDDGRACVVCKPRSATLLRQAAREYFALREIASKNSRLQNDAVARREVEERLTAAKERLDSVFEQCFLFGGGQTVCYYGETRLDVRSRAAFSAMLSDICDQVYSKGLRIRNELINRREVSTQGATARRMVLEAILTKQGEPNLGLLGNGPEVSIYRSCLLLSGVYRAQDGGDWQFCPPPKNSPIFHVWQAMFKFCAAATEEPRRISDLYTMLGRSPFGVKHGITPVLLAALLVAHRDELGLYYEGSFIPVLAAEHFELLVRSPEKFAVKHYGLTDVRRDILAAFEKVLLSARPQQAANSRNNSLLSFVKPLLALVRSLPRFSLNTKRVSLAAQRVRDALRYAQEPDRLLFVDLPAACGFELDGGSSVSASGAVDKFGKTLMTSLDELRGAYPQVLEVVANSLMEVFHADSRRELRSTLQQRARQTISVCQERQLKSFLNALAAENTTEISWLESVAMVASDKPVESWDDQMVLSIRQIFEVLEARLSNLEAITKTPSLKAGASIGRRVSITRHDGSELNQVVWLSEGRRKELEPLIEAVNSTVRLSNDGGILRDLALVLLEESLKCQSETVR